MLVLTSLVTKPFNEFFEHRKPDVLDTRMSLKCFLYFVNYIPDTLSPFTVTVSYTLVFYGTYLLFHNNVQTTMSVFS